jgi:hypothetical protein
MPENELWNRLSKNATIADYGLSVWGRDVALFAFEVIVQNDCDKDRNNC